MSGARWLGAIAGGVVAGAALSALMMAGEKKTGKPSELVDLGRAGAHRLGVHAVPTSGHLPNVREQTAVQGGHLLLSALAGAAYAATTDEDAGLIASGVTFGLLFYGAAHWLTGPALGLKRPEWTADPDTIGMHTMNHVLFGLATAAGARAAASY